MFADGIVKYARPLGASMERTLPYNIPGRWRLSVPWGIFGAISQERITAAVSSRETPALPPRLMTVEELALLLNTSKAAVYARHARGGIPGGLRLGRTLRFDPRIIAQWLSANSASAGGRT
jgi:predicted DNA-binding transcriptional regulator AlpA